MKFSEICIRRPVLASMMSLGLILFGVIGLNRLAVRELPDIDPPIVTVQTVYAGASALVVETQITEPLEEALTSIEGIKNLTSESREQFSSITIEFDLSRQIDIAAQDVRDRVSRVRGRLPDDIDEPVIAKQDADARPALWVALYSDRFSTLELTTLAEDLFKDRLQTVPGVSSIMLGGSKRFAIRVRLDSEKMAAHQLTVLDVEKAMKEQNVELPSGRIESWQREMSIETQGEMKTPEEYNNLVIANDGAQFVRLKDIGYAEIGVEDERSIARFKMRPAVGIGVVKQSKANTIDVAKGIKKELEKIQPLLPEDIHYAIPYDESVYVEKSIKEVWLTLGLAFLLVVLTIYIFLHNFRATIIPSITIPVSIISTFGALYFLDFSINIITMLAFVLAIGLVVDDAIVVLENIHRHIEEGMTPFQASIQGMKEIGFAVIATTVALVAVFLPMAFQTTTTGQLFVEFAIAISFAVIISTFVALTLAPMLCARILHKEKIEKKGMTFYFEKGLTYVTNQYASLLSKAIQYWWLTILISVLTLLGGIYFFEHLDQEFLPDEDKGRLFCIAIAPEGSTSEYTDSMVQKMEKIINEIPEVEGFFSAVALARGGVGQAAQGLAFIRFQENRKRHLRDIMGGAQGLRARFFNEIEGAMVIPIMPKAIGRGFSQTFQLVIQSQNLEHLNQFAKQFVQDLSSSGILMNVRTTFELNRPELRIAIDRNRAALLGVTVKDISRTLQILFGGFDLTDFNRDGKEYEVIAQLERISRLNPSDLEKVYVRNQKGHLIQLNNLVTYEVKAGPSAINHYNRFRSATIEATPIDLPLGEVIDRVEKILKEKLPAGFRYEWSGEANDLKEGSRQFIFIVILSILIIYMILAAQFESIIHPFTIMTTLPLATFGAFGALWLVNRFGVPSMSINLFSQIGLVLLVGIVTKNAILLVDYANQQTQKGVDSVTAIIQAGKVRLRPILMTALSTVAGILPIAIGFGAGAESRRPLGVTAIGGITTSTFLTLFLIPVVYVLLSKFQKSKRQDMVGLMFVLGSVIMFQGCASIGPEYQKPDIELPSQWKASPNIEMWQSAQPQDEIDKGAWWKEFEDDVLNQLMDLALAYNSDIKIAASNILQSRAVYSQNRSDFFPSIELNPVAKTSRTTKNSFTSTSASSRSFTSEYFSTPLNMSYELDLWGKIRKIRESSFAEIEVNEADYQNVMLVLLSDIATQYFQLRELDAEIEILKQTKDLREHAYHIVSQRAAGGLTSQLDVTRSKAELDQVEVIQIDTLRQRQELENNIAYLCGQSSSEFFIDKKMEEAQIPQIKKNITTHVLERRPDVSQAERRVFIANRNIGIAQTAFFPKIQIFGSAGFQSVEINNLWDWESRIWSLGPSLSMPIFSGGKNKANLQIEKEKYISTVESYRQTVLNAIREVENALTNIDLREKQAVAQMKVLISNRETAQMALHRYDQGLTTYLEVVDAERVRLQEELEQKRIRVQRLIAWISFIKSIGGSY